ncbi:MAG: BlaI/MecI/CopY family transcriptional regulator [Bacteroidota bacterium]
MEQPSESQLEILQVLWEHEPATVRFIHEELVKRKEVQYTTTLKQIQRMTQKGMVKAEKDGRSYTYTTIIKEGQVKKSLIDRLVEGAFKGSAIELAIHALGQSKPTDDELDQLKKWLEDKKKEDKK